MKHDDKVNAIQFIRPNAEFLLNDNEIQWLDKTQTQPTDTEIETGLIAYRAKVEANKADAIAAKEAAQAKLAALGLTTDDLKALGLGGN
jgi:hypothetical protein